MENLVKAQLRKLRSRVRKQSATIKEYELRIMRLISELQEKEKK